MSRIKQDVLPRAMLAVAIVTMLIGGAQLFVYLQDRSEHAAPQERLTLNCPAKVELCDITAGDDVVVTGNVNAHRVHSQRGSVNLRSRD